MQCIIPYYEHWHWLSRRISNASLPKVYHLGQQQREHLYYPLQKRFVIIILLGIATRRAPFTSEFDNNNNNNTVMTQSRECINELCMKRCPLSIYIRMCVCVCVYVIYNKKTLLNSLVISAMTVPTHTHTHTHTHTRTHTHTHTRTQDTCLLMLKIEAG